MKSVTDNIKAILSIIVVILGLGYFFMCSIRDLKPDPQILIAMVTALGTVLGFWFGNSPKSDKDNNPVAATQSGDITVKP